MVADCGPRCGRDEEDPVCGNRCRPKLAEASAADFAYLLEEDQPPSLSSYVGTETNLGDGVEVADIVCSMLRDSDRPTLQGAFGCTMSKQSCYNTVADAKSLLVSNTVAAAAAAVPTTTTADLLGSDGGAGSPSNDLYVSVPASVTVHHLTATTSQKDYDEYRSIIYSSLLEAYNQVHFLSGGSPTDGIAMMKFFDEYVETNLIDNGEEFSITVNGSFLGIDLGSLMTMMEDDAVESDPAAGHGNTIDDETFAKVFCTILRTRQLSSGHPMFANVDNCSITFAEAGVDDFDDDETASVSSTMTAAETTNVLIE